MHISDSLQQILDSLPDLILLCDRQGSIQYCNSRSGLLGYEGDELLLQPIEQLIPTAIREKHRRLMDSYSAAPHMRNMYELGSIHALSRTGELVPVSIALNPVKIMMQDCILVSMRLCQGEDRDDDGQLTRQLQLQRLERIGLLSSGIAHDMRNLLGVIDGNACLLATDSAITPVQANYASNIMLATDLLKTLCLQVLRFSEADNRQQYRLLDLNQLITSTVPLLQLALAANITIRCQLAPQPLLLYGNEGQLCQLLLNLVFNSRDAMTAARGIIIIRTDVSDCAVNKADGEEVPGILLQVEDNGQGMSTELQSRIFEPFYTTRPKGKGLGLFMINNIVSSHGGSISVNSEPGCGSVFSILLPTRQLEAEQLLHSAG